MSTITDRARECVAAIVLDFEDIENHQVAAYSGPSVFARDAIGRWPNMAHEGDCSKAENQGPWTCSRCVSEMLFAKADAILAALRDQGLKIVGRDLTNEQHEALASWPYPHFDVDVWTRCWDAANPPPPEERKT